MDLDRDYYVPYGKLKGIAWIWWKSEEEANVRWDLEGSL